MLTKFKDLFVFDGLFDDFCDFLESSQKEKPFFWEEDTSRYSLQIKMPGFQANDIKVEISDDILSITAQQQIKEGQTSIVKSFQNSIDVPTGTSIDNITALYHDGVLFITAPKIQSDSITKNIVVNDK